MVFSRMCIGMAVGLLLATTVGCGDGSEEFEPGSSRPYLVEAVPVPARDPQVEFPNDPIWREAWIPIDDPVRDGMPYTHQILEMAAITPGRVVADVGAGGGFYTFKF